MMPECAKNVTPYDLKPSASSAARRSVSSRNDAGPTRKRRGPNSTKAIPASKLIGIGKPWDLYLFDSLSRGFGSFRI